MLNKIVLLGFFFVVILTSGCANQDKIKELQSVEIREYNGENLSSWLEVRDVSIKGPQKIDISNYSLEVFGLVKDPRNYTYDQVLNNHQKYQKVVQINCVEGWSSKNLWEGVLLKDILQEVGVDLKSNNSNILFI